jgi:hypothetical protein
MIMVIGRHNSAVPYRLLGGTVKLERGFNSLELGTGIRELTSY